MCEVREVIMYRSNTSSAHYQHIPSESSGFTTAAKQTREELHFVARKQYLLLPMHQKNRRIMLNYIILQFYSMSRCINKMPKTLNINKGRSAEYLEEAAVLRHEGLDAALATLLR